MCFKDGVRSDANTSQMMYELWTSPQWAVDAMDHSDHGVEARLDGIVLWCRNWEQRVTLFGSVKPAALAWQNEVPNDARPNSKP